MAKANYGVYGSPGFFLLVVVIALVSFVVAVVFEPVRLAFVIITLVSLTVLFFVTIVFVRNRKGIIPSFITAGKIGPGSLVLDVGTGRGFPAIEIAKAVPGCRVTGIDLWGQPAEGEMHQGFVTGNTMENAVKNALIEGVQDRVVFQQLDARNLPFGPETFDTVVSFTAMHQMVSFGSSDGKQVLGGIYRVLKRGGRFVDLDIYIGGGMMEVVRDLGFQNIEMKTIRLLGNLKMLSATKP